MKFIADLHIHSKYSRATAKNLDLENLYLAAQIKGIQVVGTGDFTYPAWIEEIETKLEPAEPGLFRLKPAYAETMDAQVPERCKGPVRFILQTEISNIYKKDGRVRKNHNLIYFPDLKSVHRLNTRLDAIGNIKSDGRPILGLDAADLLALMLEVNDEGFFVPAHIWTPWFSMFGSKSGFDSMEECFGPLTEHIFAIETGLSSDPPMNWRVKDLDHVRLISNSDAHSPGYLGRNASVFDTAFSFHHIRHALEKNDLKSYLGTLDMYPHHGKYHYDGHRKCNVCLNPADTAKLDGRCPECGGILTLGVLYRVQELADRPEGYRPENRQGYRNIIPLADILSEIFQVGPKTKKVSAYYEKAIQALGPELAILVDRSLDDIKSAGVPLLAEAIEKMRTGDVNIDPGYDGEFGHVNLFTREEKENLQGERYPLFKVPEKKNRKPKAAARPKQKKQVKSVLQKKSLQQDNTLDLLEGLNTAQQKAVDSTAKAMIIQAGPGTGKTRTLTAKIASLVSKKKVMPSSILALTFTNKAAAELSDRIARYLPGSDKSNNDRPLSATFHAFCLRMLKEWNGFDGAIADDDTRRSFIRQALSGNAAPAKVRTAEILISQSKQQLKGPDDDFTEESNVLPELKTVYQTYQTLLSKTDMVDFEDLIYLTVDMLRTNETVLRQIQEQFQFIFIDEYQDLNLGQYVLTKLLAEKSNIIVIGDPDQSIYGFRGSDNAYFKAFEADFPGCEKIRLTQNYRSTQNILDASFQMISKSRESNDSLKIFSDDQTAQKLIIKENQTEFSEAVDICKMIEHWMGGTSFLSMDAGRANTGSTKEYAFSDFAVLYRTRRQAQALIEAFETHGIPFQTADRKQWMDDKALQSLMALCRVLSFTPTAHDLEAALQWLGQSESKTVSEGIRETMSADDDNPLISVCQHLSDIAITAAQQAAGHIEKILELRLVLHGLSAGDALTAVIETFDLHGKLGLETEANGNVDNLMRRAKGSDRLSDFLNELMLNSDVDDLEFQAQKVTLMTIHAAKGLEFPVVFVTGCEQGLIPFAKDGETVDDPEEERRLFYVAMTRAMDILCLTYAKKRRIYGLSKKRQRSLFIHDIEQKLKQIEAYTMRLKKQKKEIQLELF